MLVAVLFTSISFFIQEPRMTTISPYDDSSSGSSSPAADAVPIAFCRSLRPPTMTVRASRWLDHPLRAMRRVALPLILAFFAGNTGIVVFLTLSPRPERSFKALPPYSKDAPFEPLLVTTSFLVCAGTTLFVILRKRRAHVRIP
jgi:hypothetical protein